MNDELTFASVGPAGIIHYARCEPCQFGSHTGGRHSWAGPEDIAHAAKTGQPDPSDKVCGCPCAAGPVIELGPEPDFDTVSTEIEPCPVCGEAGACGYDAEGRSLIHADWDGGDDT